MGLKLKSAVIGALAAAALALTGCTSSSSTATPTSGAATSGGSASVAPSTAGGSATGTAKSTTGAFKTTSKAGGLPAGVTPQTLPTSVANVVDKRKAVAVTSCAAVTGGWGAKGTAINKSNKSVTYTITIFFTTSQATTIASANTKITVKAGETGKWTASSKFKAADTMLCVLRGVA